ncbi:MAG: hypothetical protein KKB12_03770, partial [Candidatus Omnitrophica bacterium]|nr:hypothetical protein [Candidatus Omnitrophota bacterium]
MTKAGNYEKAVRFLGIFNDAGAFGPISFHLEIRETGSDEIRLKKAGILITVRNVLAGIVYADLNGDPERKRVADNNRQILDKIESLLDEYNTAVMEFKEAEKKQARIRLWTAKERQFELHILRVRTFETEGKYKEANEEYGKVVELFKEEVEELEKELEESLQKEEKELLTKRLFMLNNRVIIAHKVKERLYAREGKNAEAEETNALLNKYLALHSQQTVVTDVGDPLSAYYRALRRAVKIAPNDASVRKKYADAMAGDYIEAARARAEAERVLREDEDFKSRVEKDLVEVTGERGKLQREMDGLKRERDVLDKEIDQLRGKLDEAILALQLEEQSRIKGEIFGVRKQKEGNDGAIKEKEARVQKIKEKLDKLEEEKETLKKKVEKSSKEFAEAQEKEKKRKAEKGENDAKGDDALQRARNAYLDAVELADDSDDGKKVAEEVADKLLDYIYGYKEKLVELTGEIDKRLERIKHTETDRKKRRMLEERFRDLRLRLAKKVVGIDAMAEAFASAQKDKVLIEGVDFPVLELLEYVTEKLKKDDKTGKLARLLLAVFMNGKISRLARVTALEGFIDLAYEKSNLSSREILPEFDEFLREVIKDVFKLTRLAEEPGLEDAILDVIAKGKGKMNVVEKLADDLKALYVEKLISDLEVLYTDIKTCHADKKQKSWHDMTGEEKKCFLARQTQIIPETERKSAEDELASYELSKSDFKQLINEADVFAGVD